MPIIQNNLGAGGNAYLPPYVYSQGRDRNNGSWNDSGGFLQQMMQMQLAETNRRKTMADQMKMQMAAMAMRQAFEGPNMEADRQLTRDQMLYQREHSDKQIGLQQEELADLRTQMQAGLESNKLRDEAFALQLTEEQDRNRRDKLERQAGAASGLAGAIGKQNEAEIKKQEMLLDQKFQTEIDEIHDYTSTFDDDFKVYDKESGYGEMIFGDDTIEAKDNILKQVGYINEKLRSDNPAVVAAAYDRGKYIMDNLKQSGGGFWSWLRGGSTVAGIHGAVTGEDIDTTKPNIWNEGPVSTLRKMMKDDKIFNKYRDFTNQKSALRIKAVDTQLEAAKGSVGAYQHFNDKEVTDYLQGAPQPAGVQAPAPQQVVPQAQQQRIPGYVPLGQWDQALEEEMHRKMMEGSY